MDGEIIDSSRLLCCTVLTALSLLVGRILAIRNLQLNFSPKTLEVFFVIELRLLES